MIVQHFQDNTFQNMKRHLLRFACRLLFSLAFPALTHAFPTSSPVPGGIVLLALKENQVAKSARYENKKLATLHENTRDYLLIGLSLASKPGKHTLTIKNTSGQTEEISFYVKAKAYKSQHLTIKNKRKVNPYEKDMDRILSEKKRKTRARKTWQANTVQVNFSPPLDGRISSIFGLRRFFNEQARRPHSGLDIAAPQGTPIAAVESGTIIEAGNFFFSGNMVYLDHGQGIITLYAHMHTIQVKTGDKIKKGQIIGTVGETGRVTGPHLHLAVIANQTLVDPLLFLPQLSLKAEEYFKNN